MELREGGGLTNLMPSGQGYRQVLLVEERDPRLGRNRYSFREACVLVPLLIHPVNESVRPRGETDLWRNQGKMVSLERAAKGLGW